MYSFRNGAALAALLLLAGCASIPNNPLNLNRIGMMRLQTVDVQVAPDATIWWGQAERDFAEKHGAEVTAELRKTKAGAEEVEKNPGSAIQFAGCPGIHSPGGCTTAAERPFT